MVLLSRPQQVKRAGTAAVTQHHEIERTRSLMTLFCRVHTLLIFRDSGVM
jgi:hypothetical protein